MIAPLLLQSILLIAPTSTTSQAGEAQSIYQDLLKHHVVDGRVNYKLIAAKHRAQLNIYIDYLASTDLPNDRNLRIGFLVDAYNALVIRSVIDHQRPRSVLDVKDFFTAKNHVVAGQKLSLDELEKNVLNPYAKDVRTHFVLVCGAVSCPILESQPFFGSNMDKRMEVAARRYLASPFGAIVNPGRITISKIFDWYRKDFGNNERILKFVRSHLAESARIRLGSPAKLGFLDYNWTLNQW